MPSDDSDSVKCTNKTRSLTKQNRKARLELIQTLLKRERSEQKALQSQILRKQRVVYETNNIFTLFKIKQDPPNPFGQNYLVLLTSGDPNIRHLQVGKLLVQYENLDSSEDFWTYVQYRFRNRLDVKADTFAFRNFADPNSNVKRIFARDCKTDADIARKIETIFLNVIDMICQDGSYKNSLIKSKNLYQL